MRCLCLLLASSLLILSACGRSAWPGLPDLPQKDWLGGEAKDSEAVPDLYEPDKTYTADELVWLAIQQSPVLNKGTINLEIQQVAKRDAQWRYLPEMSLVYTISNNMTRYYQNDSRRGATYGEMAYQLGFAGSLANPVGTYLTNRSQDELMKVAILTQRRSIVDVIRQALNSLIIIDRLEQGIDALNSQLEEAHAREDVSAIRQNTSFNLFSQTSVQTDYLREVELRMREREMALNLEKTNLKRIIGLGLDQNLKVDAGSVHALLDKFQPQNLSWKKCWDTSIEKHLAYQQVRLEEANIWLAWAQYVPGIGIAVNESAPKGQAQLSNDKPDEFLHITFSLPILDWGRRARGAESASLRKRQRMLDLIEAERQFGQNWRRLEQESELALARTETRAHSVETAQRRLGAAEVAFRNGTADRTALSDFRIRLLDQTQAWLDARQQQAQTKLNWMNTSAELGNYFLGTAGLTETTN